MKTIEFKIFKQWVHVGFNFRRFALGICIDRWGFNLDIGPIWISIEF